MAKSKTKYIVTHLNSGNEYETYAVSDADATNNIHYKLWFQYGIWTEMHDFEAVPESVVALRELRAEYDLKQQEPKYYQMTLFEVVYDS